MEYTVGSLADLISGSNTPNKPKVIKTKLKKKIETDSNPDGWETSKSEDSPTKTKKFKLISENSVNSNVDITPSKKKKRKSVQNRDDLADSDGDTPIKKPKLSENDENAERRVKKKLKDERRVLHPEELARTVFVGNVPIKTTRKAVKKHFKKYGPIETLRFRGIPVADPKISKKVAAIKKEYHPNRSTVNCYIRFSNKNDAIRAEVENGALFEDHHLRVHCCANQNKPDESKAIFIGNLGFDAEEDDLWKLFEPCGAIASVRIIRDSRTGMGKGFAYINFHDSDAVQLALEMENVKLKNRELRILLSNLNTASKNKKKNKNKTSSKPGATNFKKPPFNKNKKGPQGLEKPKFKKTHNKKQNKVTAVDETQSSGAEPKKETGFQGSKFTDKKKKHKVNKGILEKKKKIKKIAPHMKS